MNQSYKTLQLCAMNCTILCKNPTFVSIAFTFCWMLTAACMHSPSRERQSFAPPSRARPLICSRVFISSRPWIKQPSRAQSSRPIERSCRECWERCFSATWKRKRMERGKDATTKGRLVKTKDNPWIAKVMVPGERKKYQVCKTALDCWYGNYVHEM